MKKRKLSEQSCKSCKFYSSDLPLHGFCRCNPPVPVPDCNEDFDWLYPCTAHNDWCGKWEDIKATETK